MNKQTQISDIATWVALEMDTNLYPGIPAVSIELIDKSKREFGAVFEDTEEFRSKLADLRSRKLRIEPLEFADRRNRLIADINELKRSL